MQYDDPFAQNRHPFLRSFLEDERRRVSSGTEQRKDDLRLLIEIRGAELADDNELSKLFGGYLDSLLPPERPQTIPQEHRLYNQWEIGLKQELAQWQDELAVLKSQPIDGQQVLDNAKERILILLEAEATEIGLLPRQHIPENPATSPAEEFATPVSSDSGEGMTFVQLDEWGKQLGNRGTSIKPFRFLAPQRKEAPVRSWSNLLIQTAEWLINEGLLTEDECPVSFGRMHSRYLVCETPSHPTGREFHNPVQLSSGLYMEVHFSSNQAARCCGALVAHFGQDPKQFRVWLR